MKAVLIIDMPSTCSMCWQSIYCDVYKSEMMKFKGMNERLPDCPLKPLPERKGKYADLRQYDTDFHYGMGWNDCLNAITGEEE